MWSLLRLAGYLSPAPKKSPMVHVCPVLSSLRDGVHLAIPNREILQVYVDNIRFWDEDTVRSLDREAFLSAFWGGDGRRLSGLVHELVCDLLSWCGCTQPYYHGALALLLGGEGAAIDAGSDTLSGFLVVDGKGGRSAQVVIRIASSWQELDRVKKAAEAKEAAGRCQGGGTSRLRWVFTFQGLQCVALCEDAPQRP